VSIAERVRMPWFTLVSRKITGLYSGWMPDFMVLAPLEKARSISGNNDLLQTKSGTDHVFSLRLISLATVGLKKRGLSLT
jgi:hypothetical protein